MPAEDTRQSESNNFESFGILSDDVLSKVFSYLPGLETSRIRQVSRRCSQITAVNYQEMNLPLLPVVHFAFKKATGITVFVIIDTKPTPVRYKSCIRCTSTSLIIYFQFQRAFYYFQRVFGITPEIWPLAGSKGSDLAVRVPVNSMDESLGLLLDYFKRNLSIGQVIIVDENKGQNKRSSIENIDKMIELFAQSLNSCRTSPILYTEFPSESLQTYKDIQDKYNGWICDPKEFSQKDVEAVKKMTSPWLILLQQPPSAIYMQILAILMNEWMENKREIDYIRCRHVSKDGWQEAYDSLPNLSSMHPFIRFGFFGFIINTAVIGDESIIIDRNSHPSMRIRIKNGWLEICRNDLPRRSIDGL